MMTMTMMIGTMTMTNTDETTIFFPPPDPYQKVMIGDSGCPTRTEISGKDFQDALPKMEAHYSNVNLVIENKPATVKRSMPKKYTPGNYNDLFID